MSQYFNLVRFGRLLRKHAAEHARRYLLGIAVLGGGILVVLGGLSYLIHRPLDNELQTVLLLAGLLTTGLLATATAFTDLGDVRRAAPALLLPASHLEKYLVAWLFSLPLFLVVYLALFLALDAVVLQWASHSHPQLPHALLDLTSSARPLLTVVASYALIHALALFGAVYFRSLHIIKISFAVFGLVALVLVLNSRMWKLLAPELRPSVPFGDVFVAGKDQLARVELPHQLQLLAVLPLALAALLWVAAYARLTEKQL
ncbi:hypothetical protein E4631_10940 [Hymenobacter sp. UV11]|uniref:hypothetical protein n=1 Tax=Hymenobacter sp. UV11 TaxID=1849735 RepID=UPI00105F6452|nr:hypothetical protein [Hymenobacter sp. UV11]TDN40465.1 hypothetical protein A8B98_13615 [Hymenobacter sp. UV11]TFZ66525.1 hypothetical protein E4631_10940 [Hymenobacter sp. UV11]